MAYPVQFPLNTVTLNAQLADLSTASSCFVACPVRGTLVTAYSTILNSITGADATWSLEINDVAVTGSTATVTQSGSAAGDVDSCTPTALNIVNIGDRIEFKSAAGSTTTCLTNFTAVIKVKS